jgi:hypothetical protein
MGLGIGLICGAVLLQLMLYGTEMNFALPEEELRQADSLTEEQWLAMADRFGYVPLKNNEKRYTRQELDAAVEAAREEERRSGAGNPSEPMKESFAFYIQRGMNSHDVAELLFILGLVETMDEFDDYMKSHELTSNIRAGKYRFDGRPSLEEIASRITQE